MTNGGAPTDDGEMEAGGARPDAAEPPVPAGEDEQLLAMLGRALDQADPVPEHLVDGAKSAFTWRTIDAELAEIVFDSTLQSAGVRAEEMDRQVTFQAPGVEIEVMVVDASARRIVGQLIPPAERTVELVGSDRVDTASTDRLGRFAFDEVEPGPVRLVVRDADGGPMVQTEWVIF